MTPPPLARLTEFADMFGGGTEKSQQFRNCFAAVTEENGVDCLDVGSVLETSAIDGVHF
tara:strand:- start:2350 stop:2526 length:177 start_codon:yes stop_codon:yes gene_type:complete